MAIPTKEALRGLSGWKELCEVVPMEALLQYFGFLCLLFPSWLFLQECAKTHCWHSKGFGMELCCLSCTEIICVEVRFLCTVGDSLVAMAFGTWKDGRR